MRTHTHTHTPFFFFCKHLQLLYLKAGACCFVPFERDINSDKKFLSLMKRLMSLFFLFGLRTFIKFKVNMEKSINVKQQDLNERYLI